MVLPSGLKATAFTEDWWLRVANSLPFSVSQRQAVKSLLVVAMVLPSGLKATAYTESWWLRVANSLPFSVSQRREVN
jgi:hypothetical protein